MLSSSVCARSSSVLGSVVSKRNLSLHEYQSKDLMDKFGLPTQTGYTASSVCETKKYAQKMLDDGIKTVVIKSQVFAGGRGKGSLSSGLQGGVQFAKDASTAASFASKMLGYNLKTHQTPPEGLLVQKLLLAEGVNITKELYLAIILDRAQGGPCIVASREGGMDIEEVAANRPEALKVIPISIKSGIQEEHLKKVCEALMPEPKAVHLHEQLKDTVRRLYQLFIECDAAQIEINPLAVTDDDRVLCVDAKLNFDDNASFRQRKLFADEDTSATDKREIAASEMGMNFITMDGTIGNLVNGAGLAMATMDLIAFNGGRPANFLDLGGGATKEQVLKSFELMLQDKNTKCIFVNIFGGITRCDVVAQGILDAAKQCNMDRPLVVRLVGNNAEKARELLSEQNVKRLGLKITYVQDFQEASRTAVKLAAL